MLFEEAKNPQWSIKKSAVPQGLFKYFWGGVGGSGGQTKVSKFNNILRGGWGC